MMSKTKHLKARSATALLVPALIPLTIGESDATDWTGSDAVLHIHIETMPQGLGLMTLFTALFNHFLVAANWIVHNLCECVEACTKGCTGLIQCELA